jgi:hypothetical protein
MKKTKEQYTTELIAIINTDEAFIGLLRNTSGNFASEKTAERLTKLLISKGAVSALRAKMVVVFDELYTEAEIKTMLKFYKSKLGQKILQNIPYVSHASVEGSKEWIDIFIKENANEIDRIINEDVEQLPIAPEDPVLNARYHFVLKYIGEKGWGPNLENLTLAQIQEIRSQEGWKNAGQDQIKKSGENQ